LKNLSTSNLAQDFKLFKRSSFAFGNPWGNLIDSAYNFSYINPSNSILSWSAPANITSVGQFVMENSSSIFTEIKKPESHKTLSISSIYPNPAKGVFYLDIETGKNNAAQINIYNIEGKLSHSVTQIIQSGKNTIMVLLPKLSAGLYTVNIILNDGQISTKKLVIR